MGVRAEFDRWRVTVTVSPDRLTVRTRTGRDVTSALPELAPMGDALGGHAVLLDGELIANAGTAASFYRLAPVMAATSPRALRHRRLTCPVSFVAFDVLWFDGALQTHRPYRERRALLESVLAPGPAWCLSPSYGGGDGPALFAACVDYGVEGVVAKRVTSRYRPGRRSPDWVKVKGDEWRPSHTPRRHPFH